MGGEGFALIVKTSGFEVVPPLFTTVTLADPGEAIRMEDTEAVSCVPLT